MMGSLTFMYNDKMCVGIIKDELMCRIDPTFHDYAVEKIGCRTMDFTKRPMKGYVLINKSGIRTQKDFEYWISLALDFNKKAKSSKRKNSTTANIRIYASVARRYIFSAFVYQQAAVMGRRFSK